MPIFVSISVPIYVTPGLETRRALSAWLRLWTGCRLVVVLFGECRVVRTCREGRKVRRWRRAQVVFRSGVLRVSTGTLTDLLPPAAPRPGRVASRNGPFTLLADSRASVVIELIEN